MGAGPYKKTKVLPYRSLFNNEIDDVVLLAAQNEEQQSFDGKSNYEGLNLQANFSYFPAKFPTFQSKMDPSKAIVCRKQRCTVACFALHVTPLLQVKLKLH